MRFKVQALGSSRPVADRWMVGPACVRCRCRNQRWLQRKKRLSCLSRRKRRRNLGNAGVTGSSPVGDHQAITRQFQRFLSESALTFGFPLDKV